MNEPTIRLSPIDNCKSRIRRYIKHDAYVKYDWLGSPDTDDDHNIITRRQRKPVNGIMHAHAPEEFWSCWLGRTLPEDFRAISRDLDLVDSTDCKKVERGFTAISDLVRQMAEIRGIGDVAPTKALHLLRPRFVAISDSRVRPLLGIPNTEFSRSSTGPAKGKWYAERALKVQRAIRELAQENAAALDKLHVYANDFACVTAPGLLNARERREADSRCPVPLSKARVLDIVLWSYAAWGDAG